MKHIIGDLVRDGEDFDVIIHQCNCFCCMGSGIAPQIKMKYPEAYLVDQMTLYGDKEKLGTISHTVKQTNPIVCNMYSQYKYTRDQVDTNYDAMRSALKLVKEKFTGKKIGIPYLIGCGLAGGDWNIVKKIIEEELVDEDVTIVEWDQGSTKKGYLPGYKTQ